MPRYVVLALWQIDSADFVYGVPDGAAARRLAIAQIQREADFPDEFSMAVVEGHLSDAGAAAFVIVAGERLAAGIKQRIGG